MDQCRLGKSWIHCQLLQWALPQATTVEMFVSAYNIMNEVSIVTLKPACQVLTQPINHEIKD